jgi:hypothetical protein
MGRMANDADLGPAAIPGGARKIMSRARDLRRRNPTKQKPSNGNRKQADSFFKHIPTP